MAKRAATILARQMRGATRIEPNHRYHARIVHRDGRVEQTVRAVRRDGSGLLYIDTPAGGRLPLFGADIVVQLIGRVVGVYYDET